MENVIKSSAYDFALRRGETTVHELRNWTVNDEVFDLESAEVVRVDLRMNPRLCGPADLSLTASNGGLHIEGNNLSMNFGENTVMLSPGIYYYDVLVVKSGERCNWVRGQIVLENTITR